MLLLLLACSTRLAYQARLIDSRGAPIPNAQIDFESEDITCQSDTKGFCITEKKLLPETEYTITVSTLGYQPLTQTVLLTKKDRSVIDIILYSKELYLPYRKRNIDLKR